MQDLIWKIVLPLTVISFTIFNKWWYVLPVDAPDTMMTGFPLIFMSEGWHTSMSLQFFVVEFIINFALYFLFWFLALFLIDRYLLAIQINTIFLIPMWTVGALIVGGAVYVGSMPEHIYKIKRDFDLEVLDTGFKFIWEQQDRPTFEK